jgi:hypothetical protein
VWFSTSQFHDKTFLNSVRYLQRHVPYYDSKANQTQYHRDVWSKRASIGKSRLIQIGSDRAESRSGRSIGSPDGLRPCSEAHMVREGFELPNGALYDDKRPTNCGNCVGT